jgi:Tfp pilus assembly protein PilF
MAKKNILAGAMETAGNYLKVAQNTKAIWDLNDAHAEHLANQIPAHNRETTVQHKAIIRDMLDKGQYTKARQYVDKFVQRGLSNR